MFDDHPCTPVMNESQITNTTHQVLSQQPFIINNYSHKFRPIYIDILMDGHFENT
jgi:hypothetical protein